MGTKFTPELLEGAKACKSIAELVKFAKENGIETTEAEATNIFAQLNPKNDMLSDDELDAINVAGGCGAKEYDDCSVCNNGRKAAYDMDPKQLINPDVNNISIGAASAPENAAYYICKACGRKIIR